MQVAKPNRRAIVSTVMVLLLAGLLWHSMPRTPNGSGHRSAVASFQQVVVAPNLTVLQSLASHPTSSTGDLLITSLALLTGTWLLLWHARTRQPRPVAILLRTSPSRGPPSRRGARPLD